MFGTTSRISTDLGMEAAFFGLFLALFYVAETIHLVFFYDRMKLNVCIVVDAFFSFFVLFDDRYSISGFDTIFPEVGILSSLCKTTLPFVAVWHQCKLG
jgi:hypothetical protein